MKRKETIAGLTRNLLEKVGTDAFVRNGNMFVEIIADLW